LTKLIVLISGLSSLCTFSAYAGTRSYDINVLLNQPHPFSGQASDLFFSSTPSVAVPIRNIRAPTRIPGFTTPSRATTRSAAERPISNRMPATSASGRGVIAQPREKESLISEIRFGFLVHDVGPFSRNEEDGFDSNFEILFTSPSWLKKISAPRPHVGLSVNSSGDTSQAYAGLTWEWRFWRNWFIDFSLGGSIHDGKKRTARIDRKELGCRVLFRESFELGYIFQKRHSITGFLDHISNAKICGKNESLESFGIRYGYRF
jgi:lipid A 3-O-deacylase